jgi:hypothetical protein
MKRNGHARQQVELDAGVADRTQAAVIALRHGLVD